MSAPQWMLDRVEADAREQHAAWNRGDHAVYDPEVGEWSDYVASVDEWERREGFTGEHLLAMVDDHGSVAHPRLRRALVVAWFTAARQAVAS